MPTYSFEGFVLDLDQGLLKRHGRQISLRPQSFGVLSYLVKNSRRLVDKTELMGAIWGSTAVTEDSLVQCLGDVRRALGDRETLVRTIPRRGYALDAEVACNPSSVAVLPFIDLGDEPGHEEYFGDGLAEELIVELARIPGLRVASRSSSFRFRGGNRDIQGIGTALKVDAVIEGSIRRAGDRLRVSAQLVGIPDGFQIWSETYDRPMGDIFALQDELAHAIAAKLHSAYERPAAAGRRPQNLQAYHLYLTGRYFWNKRTGGGLQKAIDCWERALQKDPRYSLAYAGVADGYTLMAYFGFLAPRDAFPRVKAAVVSALAADENLAEPHVSLANLKLHYEWDFAEAENELRRAIAVNPNYYHAYHVLSHYWVAVGELEKSLEASLHALELDPLDLVLIAHLGWQYLHAGQYELGVEACQRAIDMDSGFFPAHIYLGQLLTQLQRYEEAVLAFERAAELSGGSTDAQGHLGLVHALAGRRRQALFLRDQLVRQAEQRYVSAYHIGAIHLALGESTEAVTWLERAVSERARFMTYIRFDPVLRPLLGERCLSQLVRKTMREQKRGAA